MHYKMLSISDNMFDNDETLMLKISTQYNNGTPKIFLQLVDTDDITTDENDKDYSKIHTGIVTTIKTSHFGTLYVTTLYSILYNLFSRRLSISDIFKIVTADMDELVLTTYELLIIDAFKSKESTTFTVNDVINAKIEFLDEVKHFVISNNIQYTPPADIQILSALYDSERSPLMINNMVNVERERLESLTKINDQLVGIKQIPHTDQVTSKYTRRFNIEITLPELINAHKPDVGLDIFNAATTSLNTIYIKYNSKSNIEDQHKPYEQYFKIYSNADVAIVNKRDVSYVQCNHLYVLIMYGDNEYCTFDINFSMLTADVQLPSDIHNDVILDIIQADLPIVVRNEQRIKISSSFDLFTSKIVFDAPFMYMLLNHELFSTFIYLDESKDPAYKKVKIKFHYKHISSDDSKSCLSFTVTQLFISPPDTIVTDINQLLTSNEIITKTVKLAGFDEADYQFKVGCPYVNINITNSPNIDTSATFTEIITRLFTLYDAYVENVNQIYINVIPDYSPVYLVQKTKFNTIMNIRPKNVAKLDELKNKAPDLFIDNYAVKCEADRRPTIIDQGEIHQHTNVLGLPINNPKYYFTCLNEDYPYPRAIDNVLSNKDKFPHIPCCVKTPYGKLSQPSAKTMSYTLKSKPVLERNRVGLVPKSLNDFLVVLFSDKTTDIRRRGVHTGCDSLLHCVYAALRIIDYYNTVDMEVFMYNIRKTILTNFDIDLLKQELYDYTDDDIRMLVEDTTVPFDSKLLISLLEIYFNVNIFVFNNQDSNDSVTLEIPRCHPNYPYISRKHISKLNILIYKHREMSRGKTIATQYELITYKNAVIYGSDIFNICNYAFLCSNECYITRYDNYTNDMLTYTKIHSITLALTDMIASFYTNGLFVKSQYIDKFGRVTSILLSNGVVVDIFPLYPLNIWENHKVIGLSKFNRNKIAYPNYDVCLKLFGSPTLVEISDDGTYYNGAWFRFLGIDAGLFCPFNKVSNIEIFRNVRKTKSKISTVGNTTSVEVVSRIRVLRKTLNLLIQIYKWCLIIHIKEIGYLSLPDFFKSFEKYFKIDDIGDVDTANLYNFNSLKRYFPALEHTTTKCALENLYTQTHYIVIDDNGQYKFYMYNSSYYDKIMYTLKRFYNEYYLYNMMIPLKFSNYYKHIDDFKSQENTTLIIGHSQFKEWVKEKFSNTPSLLKMYSDLKITYYMHKQPYFLAIPDTEDKDDTLAKLYMVQNVAFGKLAAINVAMTWRNDKYNLGYKSNTYKSDNSRIDRLQQTFVTVIPRHIVYGISLNNLPIVIEDNSETNDLYLELLWYGVDKYAAMIRIT